MFCFDLSTAAQRAISYNLVARNNSSATICAQLCMINLPILVNGVVENGFSVSIVLRALYMHTSYQQAAIIHYENTPIQIYRKIHLQKLKIFI